MPRNPIKKPKALRRKNIMRKKGASSQAKQIATLSRQITNMNKEQTERIRTCWQRNNLPIGNLTSSYTPFVCPIPYAPCDPIGTSPVTDAQRFADNRQIAAQQYFTKRLVFGASDAARNSNKIYHTGGKLRYQIYTTEPSYTKIGLFLIRPKKKQADQLDIDRELKGIASANAPGSAAKLYDDIDYTIHDGSGDGATVATYYGAEINRKYWDVLYSREVALTHPNASGFANNASANNSNPRNNALVASGTIKLPAGGICKAVGNLTQTGTPPSAMSALEQQYLDQRNEDSCFLVAVVNDLLTDLETVKMGFVVNDYYRAIV